jgi:hypothetical protein
MADGFNVLQALAALVGLGVGLRTLAAGWSGPSGLQRPVTLTAFRRHDAGGTPPLTGVALAVLVRRATLGSCLVSLGFFLWEVHDLVQPGRDALSLALIGFSLVIWSWVLANSLLLLVNGDVGRARRQAFSRFYKVMELSLTGELLDIVAELQGFMRRHRFELLSFDCDAACGDLAFTASRVRAGIFAVPQLLAVVGSHHGDECHLVVLSDLRSISRHDVGLCETNLDRVLRHFSAPYDPTAAKS